MAHKTWMQNKVPIEPIELRECANRKFIVKLEIVAGSAGQEQVLPILNFDAIERNYK
jgi:hypothetical protein